MTEPVERQYHRDENGLICGPLGLLRLTSEPKEPKPWFSWMWDPEEELQGFTEATVRINLGMTTAGP